MLESVCQVCHSRPASSHLLELTLDGRCRELHICSYCIAELQLDLRADPPAVDEVITTYEPPTTFHVAEDGKERRGGTDVTCGTCGLTWGEFRRLNRFGCPDCYGAFGGAEGPGLDRLLFELHGADRHAGRVPAEATGNDERRLLARKRKLEARLQAAIAREDFEEAARLRDAIRDLLGGAAT